MYLFLTIEAQNCTENGLAAILKETKNKLAVISENYSANPERYGFEFTEIAIIPSCISDDFWDGLGWKERVQIWRKRREADIRLRMDYEQFIRSDSKGKRELFIDVIIRSIKAIQSKSKGDFNGQALIEDILEALDKDYVDDSPISFQEDQ